MNRAGRGLAIVAVALCCGSVAAGDGPTVELKPVDQGDQVAGVDAADCRTLGSRIEKRRCEDTARKQAAVRKTQGSLGDVVQEDVAQGSSLNRAFN